MKHLFSSVGLNQAKAVKSIYLLVSRVIGTEKCGCNKRNFDGCKFNNRELCACVCSGLGQVLTDIPYKWKFKILKFD